MWIIWQGGGGEGPAAGAQVTKNNMKKLESLVIRKMQVKPQCIPSPTQSKCLSRIQNQKY